MGKSKELYKTSLSNCSILREDYEQTIQVREKKKTSEEKGRILMEWIEQEGRVPPVKLVYKGLGIGSLWMGVKMGKSKVLYKTILSSNPLLKADYDRYQLLKQQKQNSV